MRTFLYIFWQYTWGILQNLVGGVIYLFFRLRGCEHFRYQGALAIIWPIKAGSMSMGRFLFFYPGFRSEGHRLLSHEYGHTIQSLILGPLYLSVIGLPSLLWASLPAFERRRQRKQISYYAFAPEKWANRLGDRFAAPFSSPLLPHQMNPQHGLRPGQPHSRRPGRKSSSSPGQKNT